MATLLGLVPAQSEPLSEAYFVRAAGSLTQHRADSAHLCGTCRSAWPCAKTLAAAFMLDLHTTDAA
ncbi:hypothetical protein [Planobispora longispora]|uniref:Uncharacterized protein n=1 Tax=Planobispora longispora TaxID=28887 RepID=A0A8J3RKL6_9ACTN|nr:hypothetical protein [Planobispora longispora]BFE79407.1 hypothetical protein GCM10020093_020080 [Planobispora longispora]GIH78251.1 hypothetical protein Plo01_46800 [Planobispora longispora]